MSRDAETRIAELERVLKAIGYGWWAQALKDRGNYEAESQSVPYLSEIRVLARVALRESVQGKGAEDG